MLHMGDTLDEDVFMIFYEFKNKTRLCYSRSRGDDFSLKISLSTSSLRISRPRDLSRGRETRTRFHSRSHISSPLIGSLSNDDINSNDSAKNKEMIGRMGKKIVLHMRHAQKFISLTQSAKWQHEISKLKGLTATGTLNSKSFVLYAGLVQSFSHRFFCSVTT